MFDLKPSALSTKENLYYYGTVTCSLGARYKSYCANIGRTYFVNPTKGQEKAYKLLLEIQQEASPTRSQSHSQRGAPPPPLTPTRTLGPNPGPDPNSPGPSPDPSPSPSPSPQAPTVTVTVAATATQAINALKPGAPLSAAYNAALLRLKSKM